MPLSRITQKQILARVTLNGTDGTSADAGDFIVLDTSADENDSLVLEEHSDFGTDILSSPQTAHSVYQNFHIVLHIL